MNIGTVADVTCGENYVTIIMNGQSIGIRWPWSI